jgi:hypothetical protein
MLDELRESRQGTFQFVGRDRIPESTATDGPPLPSWKHEIGRNPTASLWRHCFNRVLTADGPEKVPLDDAVDEYRKLDDGARPKIALVI